ncbi:response regulator [Planobispora siamensis]|uniref:Response regulator n=1 Tax=Planobispora siamensis TaxID=936338 RepID=A0A8J3SPT3_9ACTN|nr:response regulator [Planobispora siamensis]GIH96702.1 response regulator [Planobispora siamensis]
MMGRERILLVDDHEANLVALEAILNPLRKTLVRARSGAEAMKALLRDDFALVLLDVVMPGMDGFETASHIKRLDQTKDVAIIFLTGADGDPSHTFRGYVAGAVDFLTKPFDPWVLRAKVQVFLDLHRKNRQLREQANLLQRMAGRSEDDVRGAELAADLAQRLVVMEEHLCAPEPGEGGLGVEAVKELSGQVATARQTCDRLVEHFRIAE